MNKTLKLGNVKSQIYKKQKGAHINRYQQFTKVSSKLVKAFLS